MIDPSPYADSPQARQLDKDLAARETPKLYLVKSAEATVSEALDAAVIRASNTERSKATIRRGLAELEAFFGTGAKR